MLSTRHLQNVLVGASALVFAGAHVIPGTDESGPVLRAAVAFVSAGTVTTYSGSNTTGSGSVAAVTKTALEAFTGAVRPLSRPNALENAFRSYFAYKTAHPTDVRKPFLYFVDYGLPSTAPRGYLFDMDRLTVVDPHLDDW